MEELKVEVKDEGLIVEQTLEEKVKIRLENLKNKKSKIYFFVPTIKEANGSTVEMYFHATVLKKDGYDVTMIIDSAEYVKPFYVDKEYLEIPTHVINSTRLSISAEDVVVIPEIYTNVMEQTVNMPSIRIVLCQSIDYMYNALLPMSSWSDFGMDSVITTSDRAKQYLESIYPNRYDIQTYTVGIPDYFKGWNKPKRPVISFLTRNSNDISKVAKDFYAKYPYYSFVVFDSMYTDTKPPRQTTRKEFADKLGKNVAAVWIDRISTFGTFPLECMASGTIPVSLMPDFDPPYLFDEENKYLENSGFWTTSIYQVADLLGKVISGYLDDAIPKEVYDSMKNISAKHTMEISEISILEAYQHFINKRIDTLENAVVKLSTPETVTDKPEVNQ